MKFHTEKFRLDKEYAEKIQEKIRVFKEKTQTRKSIFVTMVTVFGLAESEYKYSRVQNEIVLEDLFKT